MQPVLGHEGIISFDTAISFLQYFTTGAAAQVTTTRLIGSSSCSRCIGDYALFENIGTQTSSCRTYAQNLALAITFSSASRFTLTLLMAQLSAGEKKAYYLTALEQHRQLMKAAIAQMAEGNLVHALTIATSIRALLHETGSSIPLLKRLRTDYLSLPIFTTAAPKPQPTPPNVRAMTVMHIAANLMIAGGRLSLNPTINIEGSEQKTIGRWWTDLGFVVPGGSPLSRKDIILGIANKEGAHVDDDMPRNYRIMLQSKSLRIKIDDTEYESVNITKYVCGTAGVELLDCLERNLLAT